MSQKSMHVPHIYVYIQIHILYVHIHIHMEDHSLTWVS